MAQNCPSKRKGILLLPLAFGFKKKWKEKKNKKKTENFSVNGT